MSRPLSPRAVAVQGIGYATLLVALQGFWPNSHYRRAPKGAGYPARAVWGTRPAAQATARAPMRTTSRTSLGMGGRALSTNTKRPRR